MDYGYHMHGCSVSWLCTDTSDVNGIVMESEDGRGKFYHPIENNLVPYFYGNCLSKDNMTNLTCLEVCWCIFSWKYIILSNISRFWIDRILYYYK